MDDIDDPDVIVVFHAGTKKEGDVYYTTGWRVLDVTAVANDLNTALSKAYESVQKIKFKDMHYRKDIGRV
ncbi:phosphoribosylglycinamide synthetase C domain-containing protein [Mahella australiensis]|uniref:phosphoribosylglycinamide synthetase C domain-containing protein n=1 Tax=Mahella australiensis TaxID=252966 RepID=UPI0002E02A06|nr:phosphoribosylglycinamide synthetase C domain-containing protein [Mahella australiensis]